MASRAKSTFMRHWFAIEVRILVYAVIGMAVGGATWYLARLARGPTIVWTKNNPTPWNDVKPDENVKMMDVNNRFSKSWSRDKL
ncbi:hypothetical protein J3A83DRAFT_4089212 [Scleroderma citrinum]